MNTSLIKDFAGSKRAWVICLGLIAMLAAGASGLIWFLRQPQDPLADFRQTFNTMREREAEFDRNILSLQLGIAANYDGVTRAAHDITLGARDLVAGIGPESPLSVLKPAAEAFRGAAEEKLGLSEEVKASYAMLRNAVNVLPSAIADAFHHPDILRVADGTNKRAADRLNEAVNAMVSFTISPTPALHRLTEERLTALERAAQPRAAELRNAIARFIAQIRVAVRERERGNALMLAITAVPTDAAADRIEQQLQTLEAKQAGLQRRLWDLAVILSGLLALLFVAFVYVLRRRFAELDKNNRMLQQANEDVEQQLMQSAKLSALGQMVAGITHEINTPLAYVKAVFELIKERLLAQPDLIAPIGGNETEDEVHDKREELVLLLDDGLHGLQEMATLVHTMKNFSRLDKGHIETFSVEDGLQSALLIAKQQIKYVADVKLEFDSVPPIMGSPSQLRQVLLNLIMNAAEAMATMERRGLLTLRTRMTFSDTVQIDVCDNGPGIPPEELSKIFDPFFTTKPVGKGTGMGLSICYRIIENHGGTITVNSKPGKGAIFTVTLPRQDEKFPAFEPAAQRMTGGANPTQAA